MTNASRFTIAIICALGLFATACATDDPDNTGNDATNGSDTTGGDANVGEVTTGQACGLPEEDFTVIGWNASGDTTNALFPAGGQYPVDEFIVKSRSANSFPQDQLIFSRMGGTPDGTGTFDFNNLNYSACAENSAANDGNFCVTIYRTCTADNDPATCNNEVFLSQAGELEVTSTGGVGGTFTATLRNVRLSEVTISGTTSTPAPEAELWCIPEYQFSFTVSGG